MYKATLAALIVVVLLGYLFFSGPDAVAVNEKGKAEGILNKSRALVQGRKFWRNQLALATEEFTKINTPALPSSADMQDLYHKYREAENALNEKMKVLYSPEEQMANTFRIKADSLDRADKWRVIDDAAEAARQKEIEKLKIVIPILEGKLKGK